MTKERFIEILVEEGLSGSQATKLWNVKPIDAEDLVETAVRNAAKKTAKVIMEVI